MSRAVTCAYVKRGLHRPPAGKNDHGSVCSTDGPRPQQRSRASRPPMRAVSDVAKPTCAVPSCKSVATMAGWCSFHFRQQPQRVAPSPSPMRRPVRESRHEPQATLVFPGEEWHPPYQNYGMTADAYQTLMASQGGRCGVCQRKFDHRSIRFDLWACIDHDHATGRVRGLLCTRCNTRLGRLGDSLESVKAAYEYLVRAQSAPAWNDPAQLKPGIPGAIEGSHGHAR